jgi:hypothetical protein
VACVRLSIHGPGAALWRHFVWPKRKKKTFFAPPTRHKIVILSGAQDDDFVGVLTKNIPNKLAFMGCSPGVGLGIPVGLIYIQAKNSPDNLKALGRHCR